MKWNATKPPLESEWAIYDAEDGTCRIAESIEDEGHAHLIAAAPDLLEALEWAQAVIDDCDPDMLDTKQGREVCAAIAKAKGNSPC